MLSPRSTEPRTAWRQTNRWSQCGGGRKLNHRPQLLRSEAVRKLRKLRSVAQRCASCCFFFHHSPCSIYFSSFDTLFEGKVV